MAYIRKYRLELANPMVNLSKYLKDVDNDTSTITKGLLAKALSSTTSRVITDLDMSFHSTKTDSPALNECEITLRGCSNELKDFISSSKANEILVLLEVGYEGETLTTVALGTLSAATGSFEGLTREITITVSDGYSYTKEARSSFSFKKGTRYSVVLDKLVRDLGLPEGKIDNVDGVLLSPLTVNGPTYEALKQLSAVLGYEFYIQNSAIHFSRVVPASLTVIREVSPSTGLIGSPSPLDAGTGLLAGDKRSKKGIIFKHLILNYLEVGEVITISSREFNGAYKITKTTHEGDYEGNPWYVTCEAVNTLNITDPNVFMDIEPSPF